MSWMRSPLYAWGDNERVHLWARDESDLPTKKRSGVLAFDPTQYDGFTGGIAIPEPIFDALVIFRYAELCASPKEMRRAVKRAKKEAGNFGSFDFLEALGQDPAGDFRKRMEKVRRDRDGAPTPAGEGENNRPLSER